MISTAGLKPRVIRTWADRIIQYLKSLPGDVLHFVLDDYAYEYSIPSKQRASSEVERIINSINQEIPPTKEWDNFLKNQGNKLQIVNLLADYIMPGCIKNKLVFVNKGSDCYVVDHGNDSASKPELYSSHREADQKNPLHVVYAGQRTNDAVCVVADDTDIFLSLTGLSLRGARA